MQVSDVVLSSVNVGLQISQTQEDRHDVHSNPDTPPFGAGEQLLVQKKYTEPVKP